MQKKRVKQLNTSKKKVYKAIQQVLSRLEVSFKSFKQEQAMHAIIASQTPLIVMLPTGEGKSLLFIVPAYLDNTRATIIIVLYQALINNLVRRIRDSRINYIK
ncbi:hypothetical protein K469DRAFT_802648 [Zopfia rhizophila CBS 207.26]|uniref:DEAD/DEAH-box helicase domain-containing protein n=1 Tax=Zopfia rhizophila CBS 207.26 TaxID=1314779 RepID=A0A6A6DGW9_9PEZI|nr:hypothetical protein K469DRAFT_802648 [Zopfia rhizophila CBS 207.26]